MKQVKYTTRGKRYLLSGGRKYVHQALTTASILQRVVQRGNCSRTRTSSYTLQSDHAASSTPPESKTRVFTKAKRCRITSSNIRAADRRRTCHWLCGSRGPRKRAYQGRPCVRVLCGIRRRSCCNSAQKCKSSSMKTPIAQNEEIA